MNFNFEKLEVWQESINLAEKVYQMTEKFPQKEIYGLISQLRRAVTSISLNIAEGKGRYSTKEFLQFLYVTRGSLYETITLLKLAERLGFAKGNDISRLLQDCQGVLSKLSGLINSLKAPSPQPLAQSDFQGGVTP